VLTAANVFLTEPSKSSGSSARAASRSACLSSSVSMKGDRRADARPRRTSALRRHCRGDRRPAGEVVRVQVKPGQPRAAAAVAMGSGSCRWAITPASAACSSGSRNALSFRDAKEVWMILETINHPRWAPPGTSSTPRLVGEAPSISVPTLTAASVHPGKGRQDRAPWAPRSAPWARRRAGRPLPSIACAGLVTRGVTFEWERRGSPTIAGPDERCRSDRQAPGVGRRAGEGAEEAGAKTPAAAAAAATGTVAAAAK